MRVSRGFTLIEVLIAVAILAFSLVAAIAAGSNAARSASFVRDKTLATWVAHDRLTELDAQPLWPAVGDSNDDVTMGGVDWTWHAKVKETPDPTLHRIDIVVQKKKDPSHYTYASLSAFIANVGKQTQ